MAPEKSQSSNAVDGNRRYEMPRIRKQQPNMAGNEAPEAMAEALAEAQAEKQNGGQEVELGTPSPTRAPTGRQATPHGTWHAKRSKML